jgi:hypothetical protein
VTLIPCPECGTEISAAAVACPHCGHPVSGDEGFAPPSPTSPMERRWLSYGLSGTVAGLWWVAAVAYGVSAFMLATVWSNWSAYMNGDGTFTALWASDPGALDSASWASLSMWVAGILFIVWLYKAYRSGESRGAEGRRWGPGWAIGGWFIPLANLVIPKMVVNEIDRMSNPDAGEPPIDDRWKRLPRMRSSDAWWLLLLLGTAAYWTGWGLYYSTPTFDSTATGTGYALMAVGQGVLALTAALTGTVTVAIGRRLRRPHPNDEALQ